MQSIKKVVTNLDLLRAGIPVRALSEAKGELITSAYVTDGERLCRFNFGFVEDTSWREAKEITRKFVLKAGYKLVVSKLEISDD